jgi:hypothetical protein
MVTNLFAHAVSSARSLTGWLVAGAAVAGVAIGWRGGLLRRAWPVWLTAGLIYASLVPVFYSERYALALLPAAALLAGIAFGSPRFAFPLGRVWLKAVAFVLLLAWTTAATVRLQAHTFDQLPVEVLDAARALVPLRSPDDRVIARKGHLAYHAGIEPLPFPFDTTLAGLAEYARANRARWLFFSWPEAQTRPQFFALLDTAAVVPGLTVRAATRPHPAVLYEIGPEFGRTPAWMENDTLHAYHTLRGRLRVDGHDADALYNYAMVLRAMGKYREAMEFAARAEPLMPGRFEPILLRGIAALDSQDPETAERAFTRVLALDPENVPARLGLGWSLSTLGNDAGAARAWRDVVDATGDAATLQRMVEVFEAAGDAAAAARARARLAGAGAR